MKTRAAVYVGALRLSSVIILATAFLSADAWAGRLSQKTGLTTATTPPARGGYRLVFPAGYDVPVKPTGPARDSGRDSKFDHFVERLNEAGSEGYRLVSFVYDGTRLPVGLVERAGVAYEYKWLFTDGSVGGSRVTADFDNKYPELSEQGFRLADYATFEDYCNYFDTSEPGPHAQECHDGYVFLFEREKGVARPVRHAVAALTGGSEAAFLTETRRILADGFVPKHTLPVYSFWFEQAGTTARRLGGGADIEVVSTVAESSWRRSTFKKRINELAQRGYRAAMLDRGLALMYRARGGGDAAGYSYVWVKADGGLERRLVQLQARGAVYLTTYREKDQLVFEQRAVDDGARYEYKALRFKFGKAVDPSGAHARVELAPPSKEALVAFERLVGEGFAARGLFLSGDRVGVVLERPL